MECLFWMYLTVSLKTENFTVLLTFEVMAPAIVGAIIPGIVAAVFDNPNNSPEYLPK